MFALELGLGFGVMFDPRLRMTFAVLIMTVGGVFEALLFLFLVVFVRLEDEDAAAAGNGVVCRPKSKPELVRIGLWSQSGSFANSLLKPFDIILNVPNLCLHRRTALSIQHRF